MDTWKVALILFAAVTFGAAQKYFGTHIGRLSELHHAVSGDVFAVDSRTLFIKSFSYDGEGPAAYFYVGNTRAPGNQGGFRIRDERGSNGVLKKYRNKDITLTLPEGKTLRDIKWFSIWCDEFAVDFGSVAIPKGLDFPRPQKVAGLSGIHAVHSDNIVIVDAQTLLIPNFSYDGTAPDAKFWVGRGQKPTPNGLKIPDENGKEVPLRRYDRKTIVLTLPGELTVFDIGHFGVWCEAFTVDFGHVRIPDKVNVPPSLKMLGISPQSKLNCEVLHDELAFEVRWAVAGESIVIQLVAKLDDNEYMSFGVSSDTQNSAMIGGDVVVSWVNRLTGKGYAQDYFLDAKSQCSGSRGSCPDTRLKDNTNSIRLLNAAIVNDYSIVTYQRPLKAADAHDRPIFVNGSQAIIWAIGPLNQRFEVSYHSNFLKKNKLLDFGRQPFWNCPIPDSETKPLIAHAEVDNKSRPQVQKVNQQTPQKVNQQQPQRVNQQPQKVNQQVTRKSVPATEAPQRRSQTTQRPVPTPKAAPKTDAWEIPPIQCHEPEDGVFYAQMGPTGGKRGYPAITGHVGWGISWYINGLLIPEINVVRGRTYTFVIEGGNNPDTPANYHPFYITDDPIGGFEYKNEDEREKVKIFAGVHKARNGKITPSGVGRICNWTPDQKAPTADEHPSFGAYQRSLTLKCEEGEPGIITWTPDKSTPNTVYYQCFTHRYLGWKINVVDSCENIQQQASERKEIIVDFEAEPSIRHETKLFPSDNFLRQHEKDLIKHHNMNGSPPKVADLANNSELNKLITEGIKTAEALEASLLKEKFEKGQNYTKPEDEEIAKLESAPEVQQAPRRPPLPPPHVVTRPHFSSNQIPIYLRPPTGIPIYRPYKVAPRRPISVERRPPIHHHHHQQFNHPHQQQFSHPRPYLSQQSIQINHYRKPLPPMGPPPVGLRNYVKGKMPQIPLPPKQMHPVLLLGEPTEIKPFRKSSDVVVGKPSKSQVDLSTVLKTKKITEQQLRQQPYKSLKSPVKSPFKDPFNIRNESSAIIDVSDNKGFNAESVIVESGFRPIFRREDLIHRDDEDDSDEVGIEEKVSFTIPSISRRSDNDFHDVYEGEGQFFQSDAPQSFEPMFIASPQDVIALPLTNDTAEESDFMVAEASERQGIFYLPPNEVKRSAILDPLELKDPLPSQNDFVKLSSKTKKFIQNTPQFAPFLGELPRDFQFARESSPSLSAHVIKEKSTVISTKLSAVSTNDHDLRYKRDP